MKDVTAVLLCGGKGERLRPFTDEYPKPLVPLANKPIVLHLLEYLLEAGIQQFVLCVGYKAELIRKCIQRHFPGCDHFRLVDSGEASMTDRLVDAREYVRGRALVCYGDTLANVDLPGLIRFHESHGGRATLTTYPLRSPFGIVESGAGGQIHSSHEKPVLPYWINIGFLLLERGILAGLQTGSDMTEFLSELAREGRLFEFRHEGSHLTVNNEQERVHAERQLAQMFTAP
jgi:glucose-1-phosphate cytidylyltransferase